jgi:hypothetical protein
MLKRQVMLGVLPQRPCHGADTQEAIANQLSQPHPYHQTVIVSAPP